jgi:hypothetical protein
MWIGRKKMITLTTIIFFIVFLKIIRFVFKAGFRILGWLFSGLGFIISVILAVTAAGILFDALPIILILGILLIARRPA